MTTTTAVAGDLFRYYGMRERPVAVGFYADITNEDARVIAELLGQESREAFDADCPEVASALNRLSDIFLTKAAAMDVEAAA